ncbi:MAG: alpha/beta fold hydrolase [Anaerolineae bacterium]|nr:alpha/beta fold hydrolase [Anaerolineae bacterium]
MPLIQANDMHLFYKAHGDPSADPLLLICGVGQWRASWWRNVGPLAEHFYVITFDNRGIGDSDKPDVPYSLDMLAEDTLGLLDALKIERAHVFGHSLGGGIALFMARKQPQRVASLILASTLYWGPQVAMPSARAMQALQDRSGDPLELVKRGTRIATAEGFEARDPEGFQRLIDLRFSSQQTPALYLRQSSAGLAYFQQDHIADFTPPMPVLLLVGEHDEVTPPANSQAIAAAWPGAQMQAIPDAGHLFFIERADAANQAILEFLKG